MTTENNRNRGQKAPGVNPQGYDRPDDSQTTQSQLEERAKNSNTKR
ncbi:small, acid-soluble spore protein L [Bacillus kexueae]|nr:small, acid-soluble spore protein L [Bacillus kexueae]